MAAPASLVQASAEGQSLDVWLSRLPSDAGAAMSALREQAHVLASAPMAADARFTALERLRSRATELSAAQRKSYLGKPMPLADDERQAWEDHIGLWQAFYFGYALCPDAGIDPQTAATMCQRALDSLGRAIREHACAYRAIPASLWKELNSCYRSAADCSLDVLPIADKARPSSILTCRQSYLATLLHESANLYALSAAQMMVFERWLPHWLDAVDLAAVLPLELSRSPLTVDLAGQAGAQIARDLAPGDSIRYLDTSLLAPRLRELAACVRSGKSAPELDAVREVPRGTLERLLTHLYVQWCSAGTGRIDERRSSATRTQVALNMHAIHFQISGRAFRQPGLRYTREEEHDLATFGHITERTEQRLLTGRSSALEPWEIVNQSVSGLLGMCRKPDLESRIGHGQLIAMRSSSIDTPVLGVVQRLRMETDGSLSIGVRVMRGEARGIAVRPCGDSTQKYVRALLIEADPERNTPAYLILAPGSFAAGTKLEMHVSRSEIVKLGEIVEQGYGFDRMTFGPA